MVDISINEEPELKDLEKYIEKLDDGVDKLMLKNFLNAFKNEFSENQKEKELKEYCDTILDYSKEYPFFLARMESWPTEYGNIEGVRLEIIVSNRFYKG